MDVNEPGTDGDEEAMRQLARKVRERLDRGGTMRRTIPTDKEQGPDPEARPLFFPGGVDRTETDGLLSPENPFQRPGESGERSARKR